MRHLSVGLIVLVGCAPLSMQPPKAGVTSYMCRVASGVGSPLAFNSGVMLSLCHA